MMVNTFSSFIARTKLGMPRLHPGVVPRAHLLRRLNDGLRRRLTLISAPAGFGKSTLLGVWLGSLAGEFKPAIAWISLDPRDNDPVLFWSYIIAAIQTVLPEVGSTGVKLLNNPQTPPMDFVINSLINDLMEREQKGEQAAERPSLIIVLDDYQEIQTVSIHDTLTYFIENLPPSVHGVIASRTEPVLPLARWRVRDQVTEIRSQDLRFLQHEAVSFFHKTMALNLPEAIINVLEERTEGWIAGLQLAALSLRDHSDPTGFLQSFGGTHRHILDYLTMEVVDRLPENDRNFLFSTSILHRFNGPLCDAVTGRQDSQYLLEQFDRQNLFLIPLDEERQWYRYHHLFAETLQSYRVRFDHPRHQTMALNHRAASWYYEQGMTTEAIDYALAGEDFSLAAHWIEQDIKISIFHSNFYTLRGWLEMLPRELVLSKPWLCLSFAGTLLGEARFHEVEPWLRAAEDVTSDNTDKNEELRLHGWIDAIRATVSINFGDEENAILLSQSALRHLTDNDRWARAIVALNLGDAYATQGAWAKAEHSFSDSIHLSLFDGNNSIASVAMASLGVFQARQGRLRLAAETLANAMELPDSAPFSGKASIYLSEIHLEWNNLEEAERLARLGTSLCKQWGHQEHILDGLISLAYIEWAKDNLGNAQNILKQAEEILFKNLSLRLHCPRGSRGEQLRWRAERLAEFKAQISLSCGDLAYAIGWAEEREFSVDKVDPWRALTYAKLLIAQNRSQESYLLLKRIIESTQAAGYEWSFLYTSILRVKLLDADSHTEEALQLLADILLKAENEKYCRLFINEGPWMFKMLRALESHGPVKAYIQRLLHAVEGHRNIPMLARVSQPGLPEPLTERELEILRLLAAGKTNPEIAAALYLAVGTVKKHANNIYGKLSVKTRTQALIKASELGLV